MAMSVNGLIADHNDETPWSDSEWKVYISEVERIGNLILGRRTYEIMMKDGSFESFNKKPYVVVVTKSDEKSKDAIFINSPAAALSAIETAGFQEALVGGGSQLGTTFIQQDLIDEIKLDIEPIMIGKGLNLLNNIDLLKRLKLNLVKPIDEDVVQLTYEVVK